MSLTRTDDNLYLIDLLDRLLAGGVALTGDLTISLAGVDPESTWFRSLCVP